MVGIFEIFCKTRIGESILKHVSIFGLSYWKYLNQWIYNFRKQKIWGKLKGSSFWQQHITKIMDELCNSNIIKNYIFSLLSGTPHQPSQSRNGTLYWSPPSYICSLDRYKYWFTSQFFYAIQTSSELNPRPPPAEP